MKRTRSSFKYENGREFLTAKPAIEPKEGRDNLGTSKENRRQYNCTWTIIKEKNV